MPGDAIQERRYHPLHRHGPLRCPNRQLAFDEVIGAGISRLGVRIIPGPLLLRGFSTMPEVSFGKGLAAAGGEGNHPRLFGVHQKRKVV